MMRNKFKFATGIHIASIIILVLLALTLICGTALARYESQSTTELILDVQKNKQLYLLDVQTNDNGEYEVAKGWTKITEDEYTLDFLLANGSGKADYCDYNQNAVLQLVATSGLEKADNLQLVLTVGSNNYTGVATEIEKDTTLYMMYGPGWIYRFYSKSGEELTWKLLGGKLSWQEMSVTATGSSNYPIALSLIATSMQ